MKFPVGIQTFEKIRKGGYAYVDKTDLVHSLVNEGQAFFLSRPRRFGKSLLISTLEAYFKGRRELFDGLKIANLEREWPRHVVLHLDFSDGNYLDPRELGAKIDDALFHWEGDFGVTARSESLAVRFGNVIKVARRASDRGVVVLIDEYDKPLLDTLGTDLETTDEGKETLQEANRNTLKGFYATLKAQDANLRFVMLTGVTKFSQVSVFSGLNNLSDISMSLRYETLCGITPGEMEEVFAPAISELANARGKSPEETREELRRRYDGYHFSEAMTDIYNPYSLIKALYERKISDYWFQTGTPSYLIRLLSRNGVSLDKLAGRFYGVDEFANYCANDEDPLPMVFQSGYLTIKDYDELTESYKLDFPNEEVSRGFLQVAAAVHFASGMGSSALVRRLVTALAHSDMETFRTALTSFLASIPYTMRRKETEHERERYFQYTFYLILRILSTYVVELEQTQSQGRVDCVVKTSTEVYIFEFKLDGSASEALRQIDDRGYARPYEGGPLAVHKVGVSFSSATGTIEEWMEA